jgi:hypothetical protein
MAAWRIKNYQFAAWNNAFFCGGKGKRYKKEQAKNYCKDNFSHRHN